MGLIDEYVADVCICDVWDDYMLIGGVFKLSFIYYLTMLTEDYSIGFFYFINSNAFRGF